MFLSVLQNRPINEYLMVKQCLGYLLRVTVTLARAFDTQHFISNDLLAFLILLVFIFIIADAGIMEAKKSLVRFYLSQN